MKKKKSFKGLLVHSDGLGHCGRLVSGQGSAQAAVTYPSPNTRLTPTVTVFSMRRNAMGLISVTLPT